MIYCIQISSFPKSAHDIFLFPRFSYVQIKALINNTYVNLLVCIGPKRIIDNPLR